MELNSSWPKLNYTSIPEQMTLILDKAKLFSKMVGPVDHNYNLIWENIKQKFYECSWADNTRKVYILLIELLFPIYRKNKLLEFEKSGKSGIHDSYIYKL